MDQYEREDLIKDIKFYVDYVTDDEIVHAYESAKKVEKLFLPATVEYMLPYLFKLALKDNIDYIETKHIESWYIQGKFKRKNIDAMEEILSKNIREFVKERAKYITSFKTEQSIDEFEDDSPFFNKLKNRIIDHTRAWLEESLKETELEFDSIANKNSIKIPKMLYRKLYKDKQKVKIILREDGSILIK